MTVYRVDDLSVRFGDRRVVEGLGFSVAAGECLALVGESGSGKSQACLAPSACRAGWRKGLWFCLTNSLSVWLKGRYGRCAGVMQGSFSSSPCRR